MASTSISPWHALDENDVEELISRLLEAGHDVQLPAEIDSYAN